MNERIKELLKQATKEVDPHDRVWVFSKVDQAKFAELLIRKCAEICMKEIDTGLLMAPQAPWIAKQIKEHFGVEE
jgi:hypothetical protein